MNGFEVAPETLRTHARHLDVVAAMVDEAVAAASTVAADTSAFGMLVGPITAPWVDQVQQGGVDATREAAASVASSARRVRDMATQYEQADEAVATFLRETFEELW